MSSGGHKGTLRRIQCQSSRGCPGDAWRGVERTPGPLPTDAPIYYPIPMSVFKTYDIRGIWGTEVDDSLAYRIGRGLARSMKAGSFLLGYDARLHSPELYQALASGLVQEGAKVSGTGLASTPQLHYTQIEGGFPAAVMVTASHNPPLYHGFKVFDAQGGSLSYDKGLGKVEALIAGIPRAVRHRTADHGPGRGPGSLRGVCRKSVRREEAGGEDRH